ncbi:unnamed protein product [Didymodactylos carnosus]|uniref:Integrase catalytic domain-containing protein n=1 Tax=Didymodactylos carnosus TaxID=1234261 RepID=A0A815TRT3_9BILA|nr:unnamed protein product [Didymodactylos carnosus]CAF4367828.1 unnamed protein product [Didymodactylos carnosus]
MQPDARSRSGRDLSTGRLDRFWSTCWTGSGQPAGPSPFRPPKILQSDNEREFVAHVIYYLETIWTDLIIINGRPRHPQSQGLVERGNAVVQQLLDGIRFNEDFWKRIQQQMKENDDNNSAIPDIEKGIMLEENLPLDAATLFEEFDKTVS